MTHTTFIQSNMSVSSAVVKLYFPASANVLENLSLHLQARDKKPVHCTARIARKLRDKTADMDSHEVPPPDHIAGGDSKRAELCQQDLKQFTITATGASSKLRRLEATGSYERSVTHLRRESVSSDAYRWRTTDQMIQQKNFQPQN